MLGGIHAYIRTHNTHISIVFCCSSYAHDNCPCQSCQGDSCLQLCILWGFRICRRIFPLKTNQVRGLHTSCTYNYIPLHCVILVVHLYLILHRGKLFKRNIHRTQTWSSLSHKQSGIEIQTQEKKCTSH